MNPRSRGDASQFPLFDRRQGIPIAISRQFRGDGAIPAGMIFIPFCFAEAAANVLTNPQLDPFGKIPEFKFCAARVERATVPA